MDLASNSPSPFVTASQLNSFLLKSVIVAGKVINASDSMLMLDGGSGGKISVVRSRPSMVMVQPGMDVMIRGTVNQDLSIAESASFPTTDLGDNFGSSCHSILFHYCSFNIAILTLFLIVSLIDLKLYNEAAAVTSHLNYVHMFSS